MTYVFKWLKVIPLFSELESSLSYDEDKYNLY